MSENVVFRSLEASDLPAVEALDKILFPVRYSPAFYARLLTPDICAVVAEEPGGGGVVGLATARLARVGESAPQGGIQAYLMTIGVHPDYQGRGIASDLLSRISERSMLKWGPTAIVLHVKADNEPALAFYKKHGFTNHGLLKGHYFIDHKHHDAFLLSKPLSTQHASLDPLHVRLFRWFCP